MLLNSELIAVPDRNPDPAPRPPNPMDQNIDPRMMAEQPGYENGDDIEMNGMDV